MLWFCLAFIAALSQAGNDAISHMQAAYMLSIKRCSLVFGVLLDAFLFKEEKIRERLTGVTIMMCGVLVIGLWG